LTPSCFHPARQAAWTARLGTSRSLQFVSFQGLAGNIAGWTGVELRQ
jgi:hypothetical protein